MADLDALSLLSLHPIDKIVQSGEFSISHPGAIAESGSGYSNFPAIRTVQSTTPNTYGRAGIIRGVYSTNGGTTWTAIDGVIPYTQQVALYVDNVFDSNIYAGAWRSQVAIGASDTTVYCRAISDLATAVFRVDLNAPSYNAVYSGWSAIAQIFIVKWWMFERE